MTIEVRKDNSFKFRMDDITMGLLERASVYIDLNKSKFIRQSIREKAEMVIAEHDKTCFSKQDWNMFFDMVDNPQNPTENMMQAIYKYQEIVGRDGV